MKDECNLVLANIKGESVMVDKDICSLIETLNENGFNTYFSCSSHPKLKDHNGYMMFEYTERTYKFLMDIIDTIGAEINKRLCLLIEIDKYLEKCPESDISIDKALIFRFKCSNPENYDLVLKMFKFMEDKILNTKTPKVCLVNGRFVYIRQINDCVVSDLLEFSNRRVGVVISISNGYNTVMILDYNNDNVIKVGDTYKNTGIQYKYIMEIPNENT